MYDSAVSKEIQTESIQIHWNGGCCAVKSYGKAPLLGESLGKISGRYGPTVLTCLSQQYEQRVSVSFSQKVNKVSATIIPMN